MRKQLIFVCVTLLLFDCAELYILKKCHFNNYCPYNYYATKTMYDVIRGDIRDTNLQQLENCTTIALWSLNRHGTRRAGDDDTDAMRNVSTLLTSILVGHKTGRGSLCSQDLEYLSKWVWNTDLDYTTSHLTETGYAELHDIAKRLREKYPDLLTTYDPNVHYFRPTSEQRTAMSAIAFVEGLFGDNSSATIDTPRNRDDVIRPYQHCAKWQREDKDSPEAEVQIQTYYQTEEFKKVEEAIRKRTGIQDQLTPKEINALFDLCRFEKSWKPLEISPWCALFSAEDIQVIEYVDDLRHYYRNGYGSELNAELGGAALKNLFQTFENVTWNEEKRKTKVVAYFTHDTMIEMVFTALGLYDDGSPLLGEQRRPDRKWRTTFVSPFAVNMLFSLNRCADRDYRVAFYVNEVPTAVPGCSGTSSCSWREFQHKFQHFVNSDLGVCEV